MFRRFMIVCWVLFLIFSGVSLAGFVVALHYDNKSDAIILAANEEIERKKELRVEPEKAWEFDTIIATPESEKAKSRSIVFGEFVFFSGVPAVVLLLWNILCHTAHWIWMGRKAE